MLTLTRQEEGMLNGEEGSTIQKAMELLVKVGEAYGAERMLDVTNVHIMAYELEDVIFDLTASLCKDVTVRVPTSTDALHLQIERIGEMNIPEHPSLDGIRKGMLRIMDLHKRIGAMPTYTCYPHFLHELRCGEHVSITESYCATISNAWYGARTNLEGGTNAIASAVTGKTPECGMHLTENRRGQVLIQIGDDLDPEVLEYADYGALGYFAGQLSGGRIPVYQGLSKRTILSQAKYLRALARSSIPMYHIVGVTPEAWTSEAAFQGRKPEDVFIFGKKERNQIFEEMCTAPDPKVDLVTIGCPHCNIQELADVARLLEGKKVHKDVRLWVGTSSVTRHLAERMGLVDIIEGAGGFVTADMCPLGFPVWEWMKIRVGATNSSAVGDLKRLGLNVFWYGTTGDCIKAAITGRWEGN